MNNSQISFIPLLKTGVHCWEADVDTAKLRNPSPNFKTPQTRIWSLWLKFAKSMWIDLSICAWGNYILICLKFFKFRKMRWENLLRNVNLIWLKKWRNLNHQKMWLETCSWAFLKIWNTLQTSSFKSTITISVNKNKCFWLISSKQWKLIVI